MAEEMNTQTQSEQSNQWKEIKERAQALALDPRDMEALVSACRKHAWLDDVHVSPLALSSAEDLQFALQNYDWAPGTIFILDDLAFAEQNRDEWLALTRLPDSSWKSYESFSFNELTGDELLRTIKGQLDEQVMIDSANPKPSPVAESLEKIKNLEQAIGMAQDYGELDEARELERELQLLQAQTDPSVNWEEHKNGLIPRILNGEETAGTEKRTQQTQDRTNSNEKGERVYLRLHENFVQENISGKDFATGEPKPFNQVTIPKGTTIDGQDVGGYRFTPYYVNQDKFSEHMKVIPYPSDKPIHLSKALGTRDAEGTWQPELDASGKQIYDKVVVNPTDLKVAINEQRAAYLAEQKEKNNPDKKLVNTEPPSPEKTQEQARASVQMRNAQAPKAPKQMPARGK